MSITRYNYLFWLTNRGRYLQSLALKIWGDKVLLEEAWRHIALKRRDFFVWDLTLDSSFCHNYSEGKQSNNRPKSFVYWKLKVAKLKLELSSTLFGLARLFKLLKISGLFGTTKFTFRTVRVFSHLEGVFLCSLCRGRELGCKILFMGYQSEKYAFFDLLYKIYISHCRTLYSDCTRKYR